MDQTDLGLTRFDAGARYLSALRRLELEPDALFWAYDETMGGFALVLSTRLMDHVGPLALSDLLFKAHDAAATPKEINPFEVRLHSPRQTLFRRQTAVSSRVPGLADLRVEPGARAMVAGEAISPAPTPFETDDLKGFSSWVYVAGGAGRVNAAQQWRRFAEAIEAQAA